MKRLALGLALGLLAAGAMACSDDNSNPPPKDTAVVDTSKPDATTAEGGTTSDKGTPDTTIPPDTTSRDGVIAACMPHADLIALNKFPCDCWGDVANSATELQAKLPTCVSPGQIHCCPGQKKFVCE